MLELTRSSSIKDRQIQNIDDNMRLMSKWFESLHLSLAFGPLHIALH